MNEVLHHSSQIKAGQTSRPFHCKPEKASILCSHLSFLCTVAQRELHNTVLGVLPSGQPAKQAQYKQAVNQQGCPQCRQQWVLQVHQRLKTPCSGRIPLGAQPVRGVKGLLIAAQNLPGHDSRHSILPTCPQSRISAPAEGSQSLPSFKKLPTYKFTLEAIACSLVICTHNKQT